MEEQYFSDCPTIVTHPGYDDGCPLQPLTAIVGQVEEGGSTHVVRTEVVDGADQQTASHRVGACHANSRQRLIKGAIRDRPVPFIDPM